MFYNVYYVIDNKEVVSMETFYLPSRCVTSSLRDVMGIVVN